MTNHIIKARAVPDRITSVPFERQEWLISGARVRLEGTRTQALQAPEPRILRGSAAQMDTRVFEMPFLGFTPVFPIQEPPPPPEPEAPAPPLPELVEARIEWEAEARISLQEAVEQARAEAFAAGHADAEAALRAEHEATRQAFSQDVERLQQSWRTFMQQCEPMLAQLAFTLAETILESPLPEAVKSLSTRTLSTAVEHLGGTPPLKISLHPVDLFRLQESGLADQLATMHPSLRWDANADLQQGDWAVQSPAGLIRHLRDELITTFRQRLGLQDLSDDDEAIQP